MVNFSNDCRYYLSSYQKQLFDFVMENQLLREDVFSLLVNQYKIYSDDTNGWRGEFWGKIMRGACLCYKFSKNNELYKVITATVKDLISIKDKNGRLSTYPIEKEFTYWDIWSRKYTMLGLLYYYDICKSESLKSRVLKSVIRQTDYILKRIGEGKRKGNIYSTSNIYGSMNSSSILSFIVELYKRTNDLKYFDFAKEIVDSGLCGSFDLIESCLDDNLMPYQFKETKAYEMMACLNGLLEYYSITKNEKYLNAVVKFVDKLIVSDYTIVGCAGCKSEFFNHSSISQTEYYEDVSQETCVTVTLIDLCSKLFTLTKNEKYISIIERSTYNAFYGSFNNENQTMKNVDALIWLAGQMKPIYAKHESYPFDSYSPLYRGKRGRRVAGYMQMQNERSYGCCAAIGAFGFGLTTLIGIYQENDSSFYINLFNKQKVIFNKNEDKVTFNVNANIYKSNYVKISVKATNKPLSIKIRIPYWMKNLKVFVDGNLEKNPKIENNYLLINGKFSALTIKLKFTVKINKKQLNDKVYFERGPIVLTSDSRFNKNQILSEISKKDIRNLKFKICNNELFDSNLTMEATLNNRQYKFVDYSQAGKTFDSRDSLISVFFDVI